MRAQALGDRRRRSFSRSLADSPVDVFAGRLVAVVDAEVDVGGPRPGRGASRIASKALTHGLFGGYLFLWGIWDLIIASVAFWGGWSLLHGEMAGRIIGYLVAGVVLLQSFMETTYAPWYAGISAAVSLLETKSYSVQRFRLMERAGLEPATPSLQSWCSPN
jgi:hypothetical protein